MNCYRRMICLVVVMGTVCAQAQRPLPEDFAMSAKWNELDRRINQQDYAAFTEAINLPGSMAARFLWIYAHSDGWDPQARIKSLEAIKRTHGFKEYYQQQLAEMADKNEYPLSVQEVLIAIGNEEAASVMAPNLFEGGTLTQDGKVIGRLNQNTAWVLGEMNFPDAPTSENPNKYGPDEHIAWQKWAISHGMVPKEWESRVGVPEWQYRIDPNTERRQARGGRPPQSGEAQRLPDPDDASRVWPPKPGKSLGTMSQTAESGRTSAPEAVASEASQRPGGWMLWVSIAAFISAAVGGVLFYPKPKKL